MTTIFPVIMAGGTGSRLWPLSRAANPKQFQPLVTNKTMLEETIERIGRSDEQMVIAPPLVICGQAHGDLVREIFAARAITEGFILEEPMGRNTAAVAIAASLSVQEHNPDGIVVLLPADQHVTDPAAFRKALAAAIPLANDGKLTTMGIKPDRPETGYGYIRFGSNIAGMAHNVDAFVEKPNAKTAQSYLDQGDYAWNAGIFIYRADALLNEAAIYAPDILAQTKIAYASAATIGPRSKRFDPTAFASVRSESIDYAIMEKTHKSAIIGPVDMGWSDVGSWLSVRDLNTDIGPDPANVLALDCTGSLIRSDGPMIAAIGLEDFVVVAANGAILVAPIDRAQDVKKVVERLKADDRNELL